MHEFSVVTVYCESIIIKTCYRETYGGFNAPIMSQVARHTGLGMLVIDEIQHLKRQKVVGVKDANFFVTLVNTIGFQLY